jgi:hypothetical protein
MMNEKVTHNSADQAMRISGGQPDNAVSNRASFDSAVNNAQKEASNDNLDQIIDQVGKDPGLQKNVSDSDMQEGLDSLKGMNNIIRSAVDATNAADDGQFTTNEVQQMNDYIKTNFADEWAKLHGDDEKGQETGFHTLQGDGGSLDYKGKNFVDDVVDGLQHLGFDLQGENFVNEDGNKNISLETMTDYLNKAYFGDFGSELTEAGNNKGQKPVGSEGALKAEGNDGPASGVGSPASEEAAPAGGSQPEAMAPPKGASEGSGAPAAGQAEGPQGAGPAEEAGGSAPAEGAAPAGQAAPAGEAEGLSPEELLELIQKLMSGEKLQPEEMAQLGQALSQFVGEDGQFDQEGFQNAMKQAGITMPDEQMQQMTQAIAPLAEAVAAESGGDPQSITPEMFANPSEELANAMQAFSGIGQGAGESIVSSAASDSLASFGSPSMNDTLYDLIAA